MYNSITVRILLINGEGASLLANGYWTAPLRYQKEGVDRKPLERGADRKTLG